MFDLKNKQIVITGGTGVLGETICKYLAAQGANILILGRTPSKVEKLVQEIRSSGHKADAYLADVTRESQVDAAAKKIAVRYGHIDILINMAGGNMPEAIVTPDQTVLDLNSDAIKKVMDLNYQGTFIPIKCFLPLMLSKNEGNIINISSMSASRPLTRVMGYSSAKAAIDNLTRWMAVELNQKHGPNFRVNAIAPGFFLTEQNKELLTESSGNLTKRGSQIIEHTPMGRFGSPEDLLGAVHWLCSDASKFVTGTIVAVDGGFSAYAGV